MLINFMPAFSFKTSRKFTKPDVFRCFQRKFKGNTGLKQSPSLFSLFIFDIALPAGNFF